MISRIDLRDISGKIRNGAGISRDDVVGILKENNERRIDELSKLANEVRLKHLGRQVCIHGIIEFSNFCRRNCLYCGLRCENNGIKRYRLEPERIAELAVSAVKKLGYKMLVLQSGEDLYYTTGEITSILKNIFSQCRPLIFLSIGERDKAAYEKFYLAGARGVLFRFETSSEKLYRKMHPRASFRERMEHLRFMKDIGYIVASGPLVGLPGQTIDSLADDLLLVRELGAHMLSFGPFIPHPQTPLAGQRIVSPALIRKIIVAARLLVPYVRISITTAMEYLWGNDFRKIALKSGANSFMLNLTPQEVKDLYDIYPDKNKLLKHLHSQSTIAELKKMVNECGMQICRGFGREFEFAARDFVAGCPMIK